MEFNEIQFGGENTVNSNKKLSSLFFHALWIKLNSAGADTWGFS